MNKLFVSSRYMGGCSIDGLFLAYAKSDDSMLLYCRWGCMLYSCRAKDFESGAQSIISYIDGISRDCGSKIPCGTEIRMASCIPTKIKQFNVISSYGDVVYTVSQADNLRYDSSDIVCRKKAEQALGVYKKRSFVLDKLTEPCIAETEVDGFKFIIEE